MRARMDGPRKRPGNEAPRLRSESCGPRSKDHPCWRATRRPPRGPTPETSSTPPMVVAVVGPPGCGKSSLVRSLVKHYCKQTVSSIKGPITVVAGRKRRLTIIECPNDLNAMLDVAKVADLCLLMVNGERGYQMETFEFLNILQAHGMPRVIGILTHLDTFKDVERLKEVKKRLKHRFWTEIFQGAKLFYMSGIVSTGRLYTPMEVHNLARFISVTKPRPLQWRVQHPYLLVDRIEDQTGLDKIRQDKFVDRNVTLYGWVRGGVALREGQQVHMPGAGDFAITALSVLEDPCPLPEYIVQAVEAPLLPTAPTPADKDAPARRDQEAAHSPAPE